MRWYKATYKWDELEVCVQIYMRWDRATYRASLVGINLNNENPLHSTVKHYSNNQKHRNHDQNEDNIISSTSIIHYFMALCTNSKYITYCGIIIMSSPFQFVRSKKELKGKQKHKPSCDHGFMNLRNDKHLINPLIEHSIDQLPIKNKINIYFK